MHFMSSTTNVRHNENKFSGLLILVYLAFNWNLFLKYGMHVYIAKIEYTMQI